MERKDFDWRSKGDDTHEGIFNAGGTDGGSVIV